MQDILSSSSSSSSTKPLPPFLHAISLSSLPSAVNMTYTFTRVFTEVKFSLMLLLPLLDCFEGD